MTTANTPEQTREDLLAMCQRLLVEQPDPSETLGQISDVCGVALALKRLLEEERWRPIEEAPRDGTKIIVRAIGGSQVAWFVEYVHPFTADKLQAWCTAWNREFDAPDATCNPTHFMPLPEPPQ